MNSQMTIREIRKILFDTEKHTIINSVERTNKESRDFLYSQENQEKVFKVIEYGGHLLIWDF